MELKEINNISNQFFKEADVVASVDLGFEDAVKDAVSSYEDKNAVISERKEVEKPKVDVSAPKVNANSKKENDNREASNNNSKVEKEVVAKKTFNNKENKTKEVSEAFVKTKEISDDVIVEDVLEDVLIEEGYLLEEDLDDAVVYMEGNVSEIEEPLISVSKTLENPVVLETTEVVKVEVGAAILEELEISEDVLVKETPVMEDNVLAQAKEIATMIDTDKKVKISVDVKTDKNIANSKLAINNVEMSAVVEKAMNVKEDIFSEEDADISVSEVISKEAETNLPIEEHVEVLIEDIIEAAPSIDSLEDSSNIYASSVVANPQVSGKENTSFVDSKLSSKDAFKGMSSEVIDQVKVNITKSAVKGVDKVSVQLQPEKLGSIEVKMQIAKDGKVSLQIIASKMETLEMLQKDSAELERALNEAGLQTDEKNMEFSFAGDQSNERDELKKFLGRTLEQEFENSHKEVGYISNSGVNIRV